VGKCALSSLRSLALSLVGGLHRYGAKKRAYRCAPRPILRSPLAFSAQVRDRGLAAEALDSGRFATDVRLPRRSIGADPRLILAHNTKSALALD